MKEMADF